MKAQQKAGSGTSGVPFDRLTARDVMQSEVVSVRASDTLGEVERVLSEARVSGVPVLDDDGRVLGVLSVKDLVRQRAEQPPERGDGAVAAADDLLDDVEPMAFHGLADESVCAADLMTTDVASVAPDTKLVDIARKMVEREVHRLLVVEKGRLAGLVSTMDVLRPIAGLAVRSRS
jgi:CBS domain-containing protein